MEIQHKRKGAVAYTGSQQMPNMTHSEPASGAMPRPEISTTAAPSKAPAQGGYRPPWGIVEDFVPVEKKVVRKVVKKPLRQSEWQGAVDPPSHAFSSPAESYGQGGGDDGFTFQTPSSASHLDSTPVGRGRQTSHFDNTPVGGGRQNSHFDNTPVGGGRQSSGFDNTPVGARHGADFSNTPVGGRQAPPHKTPPSGRSAAQPFDTPASASRSSVSWTNEGGDSGGGGMGGEWDPPPLKSHSRLLGGNLGPESATPGGHHITPSARPPQPGRRPAVQSRPSSMTHGQSDTTNHGEYRSASQPRSAGQTRSTSVGRKAAVSSILEETVHQANSSHSRGTHIRPPPSEPSASSSQHPPVYLDPTSPALASTHHSDGLIQFPSASRRPASPATSISGPPSRPTSASRARPGSGGTGGGTDQVFSGFGSGMSVDQGELSFGSVLSAGRKGLGDGKASLKELDSLREENSLLKEEVRHLKQMLGSVQEDRGTSSRIRSAGGDKGSGGSAQQQVGALQRYKAQIIQLQRQIAVMTEEMTSRGKLIMEAEAVLLETAGRVEEAHSMGSQAMAGGDASIAAVVTADAYKCLHRWSKEMLNRLKSARTQASRGLTRTGMQQQHGVDGWDAGSGREGGAVASGRWEVPFVPAGGNRFLLEWQHRQEEELMQQDGPGAPSPMLRMSMAAPLPPPPSVTPCTLSVASVCGGAGALLISNSILAHRLESTLAQLAPRLCSLAVLLRTVVLPAMPWLSLEASERLQGEVAEAAQAINSSGIGLTELCTLLPTADVTFGDVPSREEPRRRAAAVEAARDAWLWANGGQDEGAAQDAEDESDLGCPLGISVERVSMALLPLVKDRKTATKVVQDVLNSHIKLKAGVASRKLSLLESELRFCCRSTSLQAEHVSHLILTACMELEDGREARDEELIRSQFNSAAALQKVLDASDQLQRHPCESCVKELVETVQSSHSLLKNAPGMLTASTVDVEARVISKLSSLNDMFKKKMSGINSRRQAVRAPFPAQIQGAHSGQTGNAEYSADAFEGVILMSEATPQGQGGDPSWESPSMRGESIKKERKAAAKKPPLVQDRPGWE